MYCICPLTMVPLRKEKSDRSEMVSQILFGESAEIIDKIDSWIQLRLEYDNYTGWVDKKQMLEISDEEFSNLKSNPTYATTELIQTLLLDNGDSIQMVLGSSLPSYSNGSIHFSSIHTNIKGGHSQTNIVHTGQWIDYAMKLLNAPYLWGGRSPFGIDCSGFTQVVMKLCGIRLRRDAWEQAEQGMMINMIDESRPGDLAFFDNEEGRIVHVGIIMLENKIIHASGKVRIDKLDHQGIFNADLKKYSHRLRLIKRIF